MLDPSRDVVGVEKTRSFFCTCNVPSGSSNTEISVSRSCKEGFSGSYSEETGSSSLSRPWTSGFSS